MKNQLDILNNIQTVDTPPFLFTRIQTKIEQQLTERVSKKQAVVYLAGIVIIVAINMLALSSNKENSTSSDLLTKMNISPSNQLY